MAIKFAGRRSNKPSGDKGWDVRLRIAAIVVAVLPIGGTAYAWLDAHENSDLAMQMQICRQLSEAAALVAAAKTKETALTELAKYEVTYRGAAHTVIKDKGVIAAKKTFYWTAQEKIAKGEVPSQEISDMTVNLSESCKSMNKPWF